MHFVLAENRRIQHFLNDSNHWLFCSTLGTPNVFLLNTQSVICFFTIAAVTGSSTCQL
jgi:hypothetical protein